MNKIILADSQAIFRAGTAKVLATDEDMRIIAQCTDIDRMHHAITTFPGSVVLFASSLRPDLTRLRMLTRHSRLTWLPRLIRPARRFRLPARFNARDIRRSIHRRRRAPNPRFIPPDLRALWSNRTGLRFID